MQGVADQTATERQACWRAKQRRAKIWANSARRPTPKRADKDFWPTPPELQVALIRYVLPLLPEVQPLECQASEVAWTAGKRMDGLLARPGCARIRWLPMRS